MRLDEACQPFFGRHETFHLRWGWIKKAVDAASRPENFLGDDAMMRLGVGKNQVRSIRFWGHATKMLTHIEDDSARGSTSVPTELGWSIFGPGGLDPFSEHLSTLWLLHWLMLAPQSEMPVWWSAFFEFGALEFSDEQLQSFIEDQVEATSSWRTPNNKTIGKDISCLLRTYSTTPAGRGKRQTFDDAVDGPFRELGLIRPSSQGGRIYRFVHGPKPTLHPSIVLFAALDFLARTNSSSQTVTVSRLAAEAGAPGKAFRLSESDLTDLILEAAQIHQDIITLAQPAGVLQIGFHGSPESCATQILCDHYLRLGVQPEVQDDISLSGPRSQRPHPEFSDNRAVNTVEGMVLT